MRSYDASIVEGLLITLNDNRTVNLSPMGVRFSNDGNMILLRPFKTSRTYQNLAREAVGVFHITDDAVLIARAAIGDIDALPALTPIDGTELSYLSDACQWHYLKLQSHDLSEARAIFEMRVSDHGVIRNFIGFNRAKNSLVEAAILATRVGILPEAKITQHLEFLQPSVEKTGGDSEKRTFSQLKSKILSEIADAKNSTFG